MRLGAVQSGNQTVPEYYCACMGAYVATAADCECADPLQPVSPEVTRDAMHTLPPVKRPPPTIYGQPIVFTTAPAQAQQPSMLPWLIGGAVVLWLLSK